MSMFDRFNIEVMLGLKERKNGKRMRKDKKIRNAKEIGLSLLFGSKIN